MTIFDASKRLHGAQSIGQKVLQSAVRRRKAKRKLGESLRGNRIKATGLRASERKSASERVSEREGFRDF